MTEAKIPNVDADDANADWIKHVPPGSAVFDARSRNAKTALSARGSNGKWIIAAAADLKYSEDQPRDERGRWSAAGSAGEAADFTRSLPGVKNVTGAENAPLLVQNTVNKGLSRMSDAGYAVPSEIHYAGMGEAEGDTVAQYDPTHDRMTINTDHPFWTDPEKNGARDERVGRTSHGAAEQPVVHELGHKAHGDTAGAWANVSTFGDPRSGRGADAEQDTAMKVSSYAGYAPNEFVAETFAGKLLGKSYDADVDKLYDKYHGPPIAGPLKTRRRQRHG